MQAILRGLLTSSRSNRVKRFWFFLRPSISGLRYMFYDRIYSL